MEEAIKSATRFEDAEVIAIKLENSEKTFFVQKSLLYSASNYFAKVLDSAFKEGSERTLKLPGCDESSLQLFLHWLCYRTLPDLLKELKCPSPDFEEKKTAFQNVHIRLWCFADQYLIPMLQNDTMRSLLEFYGNYNVNPESLKLAFEMSSPSSALCEAVADEAATDYLKDAQRGFDWFDDEAMDTLGATPGVMKALMSRLAKLDSKNDAKIGIVSAYHKFQRGYEGYLVKTAEV